MGLSGTLWFHNHKTSLVQLTPTKDMNSAGVTPSGTRPRIRDLMSFGVICGNAGNSGNVNCFLTGS